MNGYGGETEAPLRNVRIDGRTAVINGTKGAMSSP